MFVVQFAADSLRAERLRIARGLSEMRFWLESPIENLPPRALVVVAMVIELRRELRYYCGIAHERLSELENFLHQHGQYRTDPKIQACDQCLSNYV